MIFLIYLIFGLCAKISAFIPCKTADDKNIISLIEKRKIRPETMSKREFSRFDKYSHQGIILYIEDFKYCEVEDILLEADSRVDDNDLIHLGELEFKIILTPGHTKGGICIYNEKERLIFTSLSVVLYQLVSEISSVAGC